MAVLLVEINQTDLAIELASKERKRNPDNLLLLETLIHALLEKKDYQQAHKLLDDYLSEKQNHTFSRLRAMILLAEKNYGQARQILENMLSENSNAKYPPEDFSSLHLLAIVY